MQKSTLKIVHLILSFILLIFLIYNLNKFNLSSISISSQGCCLFSKSDEIGVADYNADLNAAANSSWSEEKKKNSSTNSIFIGGFFRSGTSLMRAILDSHPNISCGPETKIIPGLLEWYANFREYYNQSDPLRKYFKNTRIKEETLNKAMADFIRTVIVNRDIPKASSNKNIHMCTKDPVDAKYIKYLQKFFPNMKFILMVRDIRAVMHSFLWRIKSKQSLSIHPDSLIQNWNTNVDQYVRDCKSLGPSGCLIVVYEQLVEHKERTLKKIVEFLNVEWADSMMNHEKFVGDRVLLSDTEWSTDQIVKPTYTDSVDAWVGKLPDDVLKLFNKSSNTLLEQLGYNPKANTSMNNTPI